MEILIGMFLFLIAHAPQLTGLILPPFVQYLNREVPRGHERFIVTILVCAFVATLIQWDKMISGSPEAVAFTLGLIFFESQVVYRLYFKNSWISNVIEHGVETTSTSP